MIAVLALLGCGAGDDGRTESAGVQLDLAEYDRMEDGASWTWRDDQGEDEPDEEQLLRGRLVDDVLAFRRGFRWADGQPWGELLWDVSDGLELRTWELGADVGEGPVRLFDVAPAQGDQHHINGWRCVTDTQSSVDTFYALFDDAITARCEADDDGRVWTFSFGRGVGLVRMDGQGVTLDLVAAW